MAYVSADDLHYANSAVIGPILCIPGMLANILSLIVWNQPAMRSGSTGRYLSGQAIADFSVLFFFIMTDSAMAWDDQLETQAAFGWFYSYIGYPGFFLSIICSIWFTVGVTIDRYIMVCWITRAKTLCSEKRATFGLIMITISCFIINIPHYFTYEPVNEDNHTKAMRMTEFGEGEGGQLYEFWIHCIILILIPWVAVLGMNMKIIQQISESNKRMADNKTKESMKKSKDSQNQITRILLCVTFSFLFFIGIQCIVQCLWMQKPPGANWNMVSSSWAFGKLGVVLNSSLNFLFYCLTGRRFRNELRHMLGIKKPDSQFTSLVNTPSTTSTANPSSSTSGI